MVATQMNLPYYRPKDVGLENSSILTIVEEFKAGILKKPPHQRDDVWEPEKKKAWVARIKTPRRPKGQVLTYELTGKPDQFINDGLQRTLASLDYLEDPQKYGDDTQTARQVLSSVKISVDHDIYQNHDEALFDFIHVNFGTQLTPYEMCQGVLSLMDGYDVHWGNILRDIHNEVSNNVSRLITTSTTQRSAKHRYLRHDLSLFYRFLSEEKNVVNYNIANSQIKDLNDIKAKKIIEWKLREFLVEVRPDEAYRQLKLFRRLTQEIAGDIISVMTETKWGNAGVEEQLARWLMDVGIWRRNNQIPPPIWLDYIAKVLKYSNGASGVIDPSNPRRRVGLGLGKLGNLFPSCKVVESELYNGKPKRDSKRKVAKIGLEDHHEAAFSRHGNGTTVPISASLNRSIGAG